MRILTAIPIFIITFGALGQVNINQKTEEGQKTGKWIEFHQNGKIDKVWYYEPAERKLSFAEAMFEDDVITPAAVKNKDSLLTQYYDDLKWSEKYEYHDDWNLKRIIRTENSEKPIFLYGANREIGLKSAEFNFIEKVNNKKTISVELINNTDRPITLTPKFSSKNITSDNQEIVCSPNQISAFAFKLTFEANDNNYIITLRSEDILIDISVATFGYHIDSKDVEKGEQLTVKKRFIFHRTGGEALLKLYDKNKGKELKTISLARQRTNIDLKKIKRGDYWLCMIDYSQDKQTFVKIKVEK